MQSAASTASLQGACACRLHGVHGAIGGRTAVAPDAFVGLPPRVLLSCGSDIETQLRAGKMHDRKPLSFPKALMVKLRQPPPASPAAPPAAVPHPEPPSASSLHGAAQALLAGAPQHPAAAGLAPGLLLQQAIGAAAPAVVAGLSVSPAAQGLGGAGVGAPVEPQPGMRRKRAVSGAAPAEPSAKAFRAAQLGVAGVDGSITGWAAHAPADRGPDDSHNS